MLGGPVLLFDAVRTARRSRLALFRSLYALLLLFFLFIVYTSWFGHDLASGLTGIMDEQRIPAGDQARFAASFFHTFLVVQFLVVVLLTPAFAGGTVAEEREKGTLELLFLTQLEPRAILLGKLASQVGHLLLLLLAGVPVLAILQLLGGVDPALIVAAFSVTLLTLISTTAISLSCSAGAGRTREAVFQSYGVLFSVQLGLTVLLGSCFGVFLRMGLPDVLLSVLAAGGVIPTYALVEHLSSQGRLGTALPLFILGQVLGHGGITWFFLRMAETRLRRTLAHRPDVPPPPLVEVMSAAPTWHPPVGEQPLYWKELHVERGIVGGTEGQELNKVIVFLGMVFVAQFFLVALTALATSEKRALRELAGLHGMVLLPVLACVTMLRLALRGSGSLSGERDRRTLDSLLTTDLTNGDILAEKWRGCWATQKGMYLVLTALLLVGICIGNGVRTLPILAASLLAQLAFALSLGMYCSLICRSTFRATVLTLVALLAIGLGHWLLYAVGHAAGAAFGWPESTHRMLTALHSCGLTPPANLATLAELGQMSGEFDDRRDTSDRFLGAVAGVLVYALLTLLLWWRLRVRFGPETGRRR